MLSGVSSTVTATGALRSRNGLRMTRRTGGNSIRPWRCSISIRPRHTIERNAPLACTQFQASHSRSDRLRRLELRVLRRSACG